MNHIIPVDSFLDNSKDFLMFEAFVMMETNKNILFVFSSNDLKILNVNNNEYELNKVKETMIGEPNYVSLISKLSLDFEFSIYSLLSTDYFLTGRPGDAHLLVLDIQNAIKNNIIQLVDNKITASHLKTLYPNGFYSLLGYKSRLNQFLY